MANDINIRIGAKLDGLTRGIKKAQGSLTRFANFTANTGRELSTNVSLPIAAIGAAAVNTFAQFEKTKLGLTALYQSADIAESVFSSLKDVVKDTRTTLDLKSASTAALQLKSVGVEGEKAINIIRQLGIATTVSGASADDFGEVTRQLTQTIAAGKILETELKIIKQRIPGLAGILNEEFGAVTAAGLNNQGVGVDEFVNRLTKAIEASDQYQNVQGGLSKAIETFGIEMQIAGAEIGEVISKSLNLPKLIERISSGISSLVERFKALPPDLQSTIIKITGLAAAIGPLLLGIGTLTKTSLLFSTGLKTVTGTLGILVTGPLSKAFGLFKSLGLLFTNNIGRAIFLSKAIGGIGSIIKTVLNPIGLLITGFTAAYSRSETFRNIISQLVDKIKGIAIRVVSSFGASLSDVAKIGGKVVAVLAGSVTVIATLLSSVVSFVGGVAGAVKNIAKGEFSAAWKSIKGGAVDAFDTAASAVDNFKSVYDDVLNGTSSVTASSVSALPSGIGNTGGGAATTAASQTAAAVEEIEINFNRTSRAAQGLTDGLTRDLSSLTGLVQVNASNLQGYTSYIGGYLSELDLAAEKNSAFGDSFNLLSEKINITKSALSEAVEQFGANSAEVEYLKEQLFSLNTEFENINQQQDRISSFVGIFDQIGTEIENLASQGALSFKSFANAALSAISDVIGALIKQGVAAAVANAFKNPAGIIPPVGLALAGVAGAGASALFKGLINKISPPGLAAGGIIPPGFEGDRFPAMLNSGEAVIPLDKLFKVLGGGSGPSEFVVRGADLVAVMNRANYNNGRTGI